MGIKSRILHAAAVAKDDKQAASRYPSLFPFYPSLLLHMREYTIAAIPGDGIGTEVIAAGLQALQVLAERDGGFKLNIEHFPWSSDYYKKNGYYIPDGGLLTEDAALN